MIYSILLGLHLAGAAITAVIAAYTSVVLWQKNSEQYRSSAIWLSIVAGFEVLTGTALAAVSLEISALLLCRNLALYLSFVALLEIILFARMKQTSIFFPLRPVLSPIVGSLVLFASALAYGL